MEKCSLKLHKELDAISYCQPCKIFMCNKCEKLHSELFENHNLFKIEKGKDINEIFTGFCKEKNHNCELKYFCKSHNKLCCAECITSIKDNDNGMHKDCNICLIQKIEDEKRNKLKNNIKILENSSINLNKTIEELKQLFEKINESKEKLKTEIQKIFTKLRNELNNREDELLEEVDIKYDDILGDDHILKQVDKIPLKIKLSLEKGKLIDSEWKNDKLNSLINDCIIIENYISDINKITESIQKFNSKKSELKFISLKEDYIIKQIKEFGKLSNKLPCKLFNSKIEFNENLVEKWLNNRKFISQLLFRKTDDVSTPKCFHDKCDNKGNTIIFIETTKGYKFGGYTELQWDTSSGYKTDKSTFLFSFDHQEKYIPKNDNSTIRCDAEAGPWFGCNYPQIILRSLNRGRSWNNSQNTFVENQKLTNGEEYWDVKELEVFQIIVI